MNTPKLIKGQSTKTEFSEANMQSVLKPLFEHIEAAPDRKEWSLRYMAACQTARFIRAKYRSDEPRLWRSAAIKFYRDELRDLKERRREVEKYHAELREKGIPRAQWGPYMSPEQKNQQKEWLDYVKLCQSTGRPIPWEKRYPRWPAASAD